MFFMLVFSLQSLKTYGTDRCVNGGVKLEGFSAADDSCGSSARIIPRV